MMLKSLSAGLILASAVSARSPLGADECTWGPSHWCKSEATAKKCNVDDWCEEQKLGYAASKAKTGFEAPPPPPVAVDEPALGANECTWGPGYWCSSEEAADSCNMKDWCVEEKVGYAASKSKSGFGAPGANKCTWGPGHWCSSEEAAEDCGMKDWCVEKKMGYAASKAKTAYEPIPEPEEEPIEGANECTWGPSHWCSSKQVAKKCGQHAVAYCTRRRMGAFAKKSKTAFEPIQEPEDEPLLGANECTWGPNHWCSDKKIAEKCGKHAVSFCTRRKMGAFRN